MKGARFKLLSFIICTLFIVVITLMLQPQKILAQTSDVVSVTYQGHVQSIGWQPWVLSGGEAGTDGKSLRVEALKINLINAPNGATINYQAHVQNIGWQPLVQGGVEAGTHGRSLRVEAIKITLKNMPGYSVEYQAHVQSIGWQPWVQDGAEAGTHGQSLRVEAIRIRIVPNIVHPGLVSINKTTDNLIVGAVDTLAAVLSPANTPNKAVTWVSSKPSVVAVDSNGKITARSVGSAIITVTTVDGNKAASCAVTVKNIVNNSIITLTNYNMSIGDFTSQELSDTPAAFINGQWSYAIIVGGQEGYCTDPLKVNSTWVCSPTVYNNIKSQLLCNINPLNYQNDPTKIYEFVTLNFTDCVSAAQLNTMFGTRGQLTGKGQVFIDAAKANNVNPIYLAGHAILESNHGTSLLATGGTKDIAGNYTYGIAVYNLFGIGAIDGDADAGGTKTAFCNGWTSIDLAIYGGAAWISKGYIGASQNTLYSMRWNPLNIYHQYATDVNWAASQTNIIKSYFDLLPGSSLTFNIPVFK